MARRSRREAAGTVARVSALLVTGDFVALSKPAGISMATSRRAGGSEDDVVARLLSACGVEEDLGRLWLVHRLDVGTSGLVLLARTAEAHRRVCAAFQARQVTKKYRALVWGHPVPAASRIEGALGRDPRDGRRMRVVAQVAQGKPAVTAYATRRRLPSVADLIVTPETGRTHQIRVHLAWRGHPIVGDDLYGALLRHRGVRDPGRRGLLAGVTHPLLHAERLVVPDEGLDIEALLPDDYRRILSALGGS